MKTTLTVSLLLPALALALAPDLDAQRGRRGRGGPPPELANGTFKTGTFESKALGAEHAYGIYLPNGWDAEGAEFPLVVYLHGMWEDHQRFHSRGISKVLDDAIGDGSIEPVVLVTANGDRSSFWVNGKRSGNYASMVTEDLLAHVTRTYPVSEERRQRALLGVSMGGFGALNIAFQNPQRFGAVMAHSAALLPQDPDLIEERFPWIQRFGGAQRALGALFGDPIDKEMWAANNPLLQAESLDPKALDGLKIYFDCGTEDRYGFHAPNVELHELLEARQIPHTWESVEGGQHGTDYNKQRLPHSLRFFQVARATGRAAAGLGRMFETGTGDASEGKQDGKDDQGREKGKEDGDTPR